MVDQITLYEQEQSHQTGLSKADHIREATEAWRKSDDPKSFVQALAERRYKLECKGDFKMEQETEQ